MPPILLDVAHFRQRAEADCLAACAATVLRNLGRAVDYQSLLKLLDIRSYGAPAGNLRRLSQLGLRVFYRSGNVSGLEAQLAKGKPAIVFVRTRELPYWEQDTAHALVIVGYDREAIFVLDPFYPAEAPIAVARGDFELAWLERDYYHAVIQEG